ncbi:MAG TPA: tail fiber protein [Kofleriaceae bacterium]
MGSPGNYTYSLTSALGNTTFQTDLFPFLQTYLIGSSATQLVIRSATDISAPDGTHLTLSGVCDVLGMTGAAATLTFVNTTGQALTDSPGDQPRARCIAIQLVITPPVGYLLTQSFPALANTLFGDSGFALTNPVFFLASCSYRDPVRTLQIEYGLSLSGQVAPSGPLAGIAALTGVSAPQACYGPIAWTTDPTQRTPLLALHLAGTFGFASPPFPLTLPLSIALTTQYQSPGTVTAAITASAPLTIGSLDPITISGPVQPNGGAALAYAFTLPRAIAWADVNLWQSQTPPQNAVPAALRTGTLALSRIQLGLQGRPLGVTTDVWVQPSPAWPVPGTTRTLSTITAHLTATSATSTSATLAGLLGVGSGKVALGSESSTTAFAPPFTLALDPSQPAPPPPTAAEALADAYPAWSTALPAPIAGLGAQIAIRTYTIAVAAGTTPTSTTSVAFAASVLTAAWPVLSNGVTLSLTALDVNAIGGQNPSATVGGTATLGGQPVIVSAPVIGSQFTAYAFTFDSAAALPTVTSLATQLALAASMPAAVQAIGTSYTFDEVAITISTSQTAATTVSVKLSSTSTWTGWPVVNGPTYKDTVASATLALAGRQTGGGVATTSGAITGSIVLAGQTSPFTLALPASTTTFTAAVPAGTSFTVKTLTTAIDSTQTTPGWLAGTKLQAGSALVDYSAQSLVATLGIGGSISVGDGSTLSGATMTASTSAGAASLCITCKRNVEGLDPIDGWLYAPYKRLLYTAAGPNGIDIPVPATPPDAPVSVGTLVAIAVSIGVGVAAARWAKTVFAYWRAAGAIAADPFQGLTAAERVCMAFSQACTARAIAFPLILGTLATGMVLWLELQVRQMSVGFGSVPGTNPQNVAPALKTAIPTLAAEECIDGLLAGFPTTDAPTMAAALQAAGYSPAEAAVGLRASYGTETETAAQMATLLAGAYGALDAPTLAGALAASGYHVSDVAPLLRQLYPTTAGTAAQLTAILAAAYGDALTSTDLASALEQGGFSILAITPPIMLAFPRRTLNQIAIDVTSPYAATAPASAMQLGIALATGGATPNSATPAIVAALPATTTSQLAAVRAAAFEADLQTALAAGLAQQQAGASAAAVAMCAAAPQLSPGALGGALYAIFTPPPLGANALVAATLAGMPGATPVSLASALVGAVVPIAITATQVAVALVAALPALTAVSCARALKATGFAMADALAALLAAGYSTTDAQAAIAQVYLAGIVQAGLVTTYAGDLSVPANRDALVAAGWLVCDGASYPVSQYPDLYDAILNAHGGTATQFNVPDLRDRWVRGTNGSATYGTGPVDPDVDTRTAPAAGGATGNRVGSFEAFATATPRKTWGMSTDPGHTHSFQHLTSSQHEVWGGSSETMARNPNNTVTTSAAGAHGHAFAAGGGDLETAPINRALYWIIKATET